MQGTSHRPVYLNLLQIRLPVAGVMSIVHRITGVLMFLAIPALLYLLDLSLSGAIGFAKAANVLHGGLGMLAVFGVTWSLIHHLLAGVRYLLLDVHVGVERPMYRYTAWAVLLAAPVTAALLTWGLL